VGSHLAMIYPFSDVLSRVLLATIRDKGFCLCPRCLMQKDKVDQMGLICDLSARIWLARIYFSNKVQLA
jgi:hypothetical protein